MSTVVRPSGPLPSRVYWVRRLLLLAIVVALAWVVVRVVGGGDAAGGEQATTPDPAVTTEPVDDEPAAESTDAATTARERRKERRRAQRAERDVQRRLLTVHDVTQTLDRPEGPCDLTLVQVAPEVPGPSYVGTPVPLSLGLRTQQATACTVDLDAERLLVSITSGEQPFWTSAHCPESAPQQTVVLRPSWTSTVDMVWSGRRSGRGCAADGRLAATGDYLVQAAVLTGEPGAVDFALVEPEPVEPRVEERRTEE